MMPNGEHQRLLPTMSLASATSTSNDPTEDNESQSQPYPLDLSQGEPMSFHGHDFTNDTIVETTTTTRTNTSARISEDPDNIPEDTDEEEEEIECCTANCCWTCSVYFLTAIVWLSGIIFGMYIWGHYLFRISSEATWNYFLPDLHSTWFGTTSIGLHFLGASTVLFLGFVQFWTRGSWHRWTGRIYLVASLLTACGGLWFIVSVGCIGGLVMNIGFALYGALTLLATIQTFRHARQRQFSHHAKWAWRLYALLWASWLYRLEYVQASIMFPHVAHDPQHYGYALDYVMDFFFYIPNLFVVELLWYFKHGRCRPFDKQEPTLMDTNHDDHTPNGGYYAPSRTAIPEEEEEEENTPVNSYSRYNSTNSQDGQGEPLQQQQQQQVSEPEEGVVGGRMSRPHRKRKRWNSKATLCAGVCLTLVAVLVLGLSMLYASFLWIPAMLGHLEKIPHRRPESSDDENLRKNDVSNVAMAPPPPQAQEDQYTTDDDDRQLNKNNVRRNRIENQGQPSHARDQLYRDDVRTVLIPAHTRPLWAMTMLPDPFASNGLKKEDGEGSPNDESEQEDPAW